MFFPDELFLFESLIILVRDPSRCDFSGREMPGVGDRIRGLRRRPRCGVVEGKPGLGGFRCL